MNRLGKRDVEALMTDIETEPVGAMTTALQHVLDRPDLVFDQLVELAPIEPSLQRRLHDRDEEALDELARELNETRTLGS